MFNKFSKLPTVPLAPTFTLNKSPVEVVDEPGFQLRDIKFPVVKPVDTEFSKKPLPVVRESAAKPYAFPVVVAAVCVTVPLLPIVNLVVPEADADRMS